MGPWFDITRRLSMPKDLLFLNRITIGVSSILGHLYATADWKAIDSEIRHGGPPATELGRLESAWRARGGTEAGELQTSVAEFDAPVPDHGRGQPSPRPDPRQMTTGVTPLPI